MSHRKFILAAVPVLVLAATFGLAGIPAANATTTSVSTAVDSFLSQRDPDRTYGDSRHIRTCPATCEGVGSSERRVLVQFSVSAIPVGASGVTAKIELTPWTKSSGTVTGHAITSSWTELGVTWDTRPSYGPAIASKTLNSTSQATTWDVSSLIQKNGTYGIMLKQSTGNQIDFRSSEASTGTPRLLITYSVTTTSASTSTPTPASTTTAAAPTTNGPLPFAMPTKTTLRQSEKKVFAHYFTPYPISLDNKTADLDYYTQNYLNPYGEN